MVTGGDRQRSPICVMQSLFVLHQRKYRDTSLLVEVLSEADGRFPLVFRGARNSKKRTAALVQPFQPLLVGIHGEGELRTAGEVDVAGPRHLLRGNSLMLGLYVNELLYRTLGRFESVPTIFSAYDRLLQNLASDTPSILALRQFELLLLAELGYGVDFGYDYESGEQVREDCHYQYVAELGFQRCSAVNAGSVAGRELLQIAGQGPEPQHEKIIRQVVRQSLAPLLGHRPLKSRALFEKSS